VFVHCGLHKTGTTALQTVCAEFRGRLREHGVLYPPTGNHPTAHHNLAWELTGDRRFDPAGPTLAGVAAQIAAFGGDVVLSSEDFETILDRPDLIRRLRRQLGTAARALCFVIYVRQPTAYAESLYLELLEHGYAAPFAQFVREIRSRRAVRFREWTFQFDRDRIAAALAAAGQTCIIWRAFEDAARGGGVVADFLSLLGYDPRLPDDAAAVARNVREPAAESLRLFCRGQLGRDLRNGEAAAVARLCNGTSSQRLAAGPRFRLDDDGRAEGAAARLERVCSRPTATAVAAIARLAERQPGIAQVAERALTGWWGGVWHRP
jgi:hypothetical protein